jgi:hypothetical protein
MSFNPVGRNDSCPCGSGRKFKHCCYSKSFRGEVSRSRPIYGDGAASSRAPQSAERLATREHPKFRIGVDYSFDDAFGKAEVTYLYPAGVHVILENGDVALVEHLKPGIRFQLEDGGVATVCKVDSPREWGAPSADKDAQERSLQRILGTVKYTGHYPRMDFTVGGQKVKTTPAHPFWSVNRKRWVLAGELEVGELLLNHENLPARVEFVGQVRWEFCELFNCEVEESHTYYVGDGTRPGVWSHNGLGMGCRVPRAATDEALETGTIYRTSRYRAGASKPPDHHIFPQEHRDFFGQRGIDIDRYQVRLTQGVHEALHYRLPGEGGGGFWNNEIMGRILAQEGALGRQLTAREILRTGAQMRRDFIPGVKLLPVGG